MKKLIKEEKIEAIDFLLNLLRKTQASISNKKPIYFEYRFLCNDFHEFLKMNSYEIDEDPIDSVRKYFPEMYLAFQKITPTRTLITTVWDWHAYKNKNDYYQVKIDFLNELKKKL